MPVLRYFVVAGVGLIALLFAVSAWLPAPVTTERDSSGFDRTTIRISGEKPVSDRVTIDTSIPTVMPPVAAAPVAEPSVVQGDAQPESQDKSRQDALARMDDAQSAAPVAAPPAAAKKVAARKHPKRPAVMPRREGLFALW